MESVVIWIGIAALAYVAWRLISGLRAERKSKGLFVLPPDITLEPQPLLTDRELILYNLIRMAVQDHFLVFARVPLWRVLCVEGEGPSRLQVLRRMALKQVDVVLVHPGSRVVEQVIQLHENGETEGDEPAIQRDIRAMVQAAGIRVTSLEAGASYTVQHLAMILGVSEEG